VDEEACAEATLLPPDADTQVVEIWRYLEISKQKKKKKKK
jgi:hypothetical protein